jgi:hypothetical protein
VIRPVTIPITESPLRMPMSAAASPAAATVDEKKHTLMALRRAQERNLRYNEDVIEVRSLPRPEQCSSGGRDEDPGTSTPG